MELSEFLLARIAEDEAAAQEARGDELAFSTRPPYAKLGFAAGDLAQRFDPPRVLAECDAKRRIVEEAARLQVIPLALPEDMQFVGARQALLATVRLLALPYADHPDYRDEWRP